MRLVTGVTPMLSKTARLPVQLGGRETGHATNEPVIQGMDEHAFSREVHIQQAAWYLIRITTGGIQSLWRPWHISRAWSRNPSGPCVGSRTSRLRKASRILLEPALLADNGWLSAMEVPVEARVRCVEAIGKLFDRLFAPRCTPNLSHLSEVAAGTLNCVCYMLWDEFPCIALPSDPYLRRLNGTALTTMEHISGTGFARVPGKCIAWAGALAASTCEQGRAHHRRICLVTNGADPRLLAYANAARFGCVLSMHRAESRMAPRTDRD